MDRNVLMAIVVGLLVVLLVLMALGWRARKRRQAHVPAPKPVPPEVGDVFITLTGFYVATCVAGEPLNRIAVQGLGFRARATISIAQYGIVIGIPGQDATFIPVEDIRGVDRATWTIDRVVERDGLVLVAWTLVDEAAKHGKASTDVDSYLRFDTAEDATEVIEAIEQLLGIAPSSQGGIA